MQLFGTQFHLWAVSRSRPEELALMQTARRQPYSEAVMQQQFLAIGAAVGKQISTLRLRRIEHGDHTCQSGVGQGRMSVGSVASQMASMRIISEGLEERSHRPQHFQRANSLWLHEKPS